jgi:YHS domain-containing protein
VNKRAAYVFSFAVLLVFVACGGKTSATATPTTKVLVLVDAEGVGLGGRDPVSYLGGAPAPGVAEHKASHGGATYRFASAESRGTFEAAKQRYAPQYGGFCAYAASQGRISEADPEVFEIVDGQLLVFTNPDFKVEFDKDVPGNKQKADANWPGLVAKHGK